MDFSEDIKVVVGPDKQTFTLHKAVLTAHSTFFRTALKNGFGKAPDCIIIHPDIDFESFRAYTQWAYSGEIVVIDPKEAAQDTKGRQERIALIKLYITADRLGDTLLRNGTIDNIIALNKATGVNFTVEMICLAYRQLGEASRLRKLILESFVWHADVVRATWLRKTRAFLLTEFWADLAISFAASNGDLASKQSDFPPDCAFHDHDSEVPACADA